MCIYSGVQGLGAAESAEKISEYIINNLDTIDEIYVALDSHQVSYFLLSNLS